MTWQGCGIECDPATSILSRVSATSHMPDFTPPKPTRQLSNRRLSGGSQGRNLSWRADDESENLIENDDQLERQQTAAAQQENVKRVAPSSFHGTPDHERRLQMYKVCVAMAVDNKVNLKNSWSLDFIDHMMDHMDWTVCYLRRVSMTTRTIAPSQHWQRLIRRFQLLLLLLRGQCCRARAFSRSAT